jgi:adenine/guanine phosphoribosyltransferase-like PRPP-binding protein
VTAIWIVHKKSSRPITRRGRVLRIISQYREQDFQKVMTRYTDGLVLASLVRMEMDNMYGVLQQ